MNLVEIQNEKTSFGCNQNWLSAPIDVPRWRDALRRLFVVRRRQIAVRLVGCQQS